MGHWFHRFFKPHCPECRHSCISCDTLREQLSIANAEKERLLKLILQRHEPKTEPVQETRNLEPIAPKITTWKQRRAMLEAEDRQKARILKEQEAELKIKDLETELKLSKEQNVNIQETSGEEGSSEREAVS